MCICHKLPLSLDVSLLSTSCFYYQVSAHYIDRAVRIFGLEIADLEIKEVAVKFCYLHPVI